MKVHLVDGTYELFRAFFGAPPGARRRWPSRRRRARPPRDAPLAPARAGRHARGVRLRPRDRVLPQRALRRVQDGRGRRPRPARAVRAGGAGRGGPRHRRLADGRVRDRRRARHGGRAPPGRPRRRAGGDLLARQGPLAVRGRPPGRSAAIAAGAPTATRRASSRSSASRPARSRTGSLSSATAPTGSRASRAGARSRPPPSWPATGGSRRSPTTPRAGTSRSAGASAWPTSLRERREEAALYRRLATLRTDVPLAEGLADLEWRGARRRDLEALVPGDRVRGAAGASAALAAGVNRPHGRGRPGRSRCARC